MPDNKLTDKEIKEAKSLRWLANQFPKVENPKDNGDRLCNCINLYCTNAAELIERQAAENINLQKENKALRDQCDYWRAEVKEARLDIIKAPKEAIKEFAEKLKRRFLNKNEVINNTIDNLLKELVGENNVS